MKFIQVRIGISDEIKKTFRINKVLKDSPTISATLTEAKRSLKQIKAMCPSDEIESESWINASEEGDQRGRVGVGWPWNK